MNTMELSRQLVISHLLTFQHPKQVLRTHRLSGAWKRQSKIGLSWILAPNRMKIAVSRGC
jgi:hypothetical protein